MALAAGELAAIRAEAERTILTESAQILRNTSQSSASDSLGGGGVQGDWKPAGDGVACRVAKVYRPKPEDIVAGQVRAMLMYETRFAVGVELLPTDRVRILTGVYPGLYSVSNVAQGQSEAILLYVWLASIEP